MLHSALFPAFRPERVLFQDARLLVVNKPAQVPVHGGNEALAADLVTRLQNSLRHQNLDDYLGVHQRLDLGTSGVLLFTRDRSMNLQIGHAMEAHEAGRVYRAVAELSKASVLRQKPRGRLEHDLEITKAGTRVAAQGKHAVTDYELLEVVGQRALLELRPQTGRTHQLRVQLAHVGASIVGDRKYNGAPCFRLLLHAAHLQINDLSFSAPQPEEFELELRSAPGWGSAERVRQAVLDAACLRHPLLKDSSAFRVVNGIGDGLPGLNLDRYGDFMVLSVASSEARERAQEIATLMGECGARGVYLKVRAKLDPRKANLEQVAPSAPIWGEAAPAELQVEEHQRKLNVQLADGLSTGLFVDQRDNRTLLQGLAAGKRCLNLFSYTCAFSVALALGGATQVTSVDVSRRALARGRQNFAINALDPEIQRWFSDDATTWLERAVRRGEQYDLIVLDPPSFGSVGKQGPFRASEEYGKLLELCVRLGAPGAKILTVTNHQGTSAQAFHALAVSAGQRAGRKLEQVKSLRSGLDCPDEWAGPAPSKSLLISV